MTPEEQIQFNRLIDLRNRLDLLEDNSINQMMLIYDKAVNDVAKEIKRTKSFKTKKAKMQLLNRLKKANKNLARLMNKYIENGYVQVGDKAFKGMEDILSWDGSDIEFNIPTEKAAFIAETIQHVPVGGELLSEWVDKTFDDPTKIQTAILTSNLKGESYRKMYNSLLNPYSKVTRAELITLARTYNQSAVVSAQERLFEENKDIVKKLRWIAVMEIGFSKSGRGTCPRCAALDGMEYTHDEPKPNRPLHPRCRCMWQPVTMSWNELFEKHRLVDKEGNPLTMDEMDTRYRKFKFREEANVDLGRRGGNIISIEDASGSYGEFITNKGGSALISVVGPNRARLISSGKIQFGDIVDARTGRLKTLKELGYPLTPKKSVKGGSGGSGSKKKKKPKKEKGVVYPVPGSGDLFAAAPAQYRGEHISKALQLDDGYRIFKEDQSRGAYYWHHTKTINMDPAIQNVHTGQIFLHELGHRVDYKHGPAYSMTNGYFHEGVQHNRTVSHSKGYMDAYTEDKKALEKIPKSDYKLLGGEGRYSKTKWKASVLYRNIETTHEIMSKTENTFKANLAYARKLADKELTGFNIKLKAFSEKIFKDMPDDSFRDQTILKSLISLINYERTGAKSFLLDSWLHRFGKSFNDHNTDIAGGCLADAISASNKDKFFGWGHTANDYKNQKANGNRESFANFFASWEDETCKEFLQKYLPNQAKEFEKFINEVLL